MADAPPPVLTLQVKKGRRGGETRQWRAGAVLRVGRVATGNDIAVRDAGASQRHLSIEFLPPPAARWAVCDVGSSNGTLLNGTPLVPTVPTPLSDGDVIKIGESTVLAVSIAPDSDPNHGPRRSSRHSAAVVVEQENPPAVIRRGGRKNVAAAAEPPVAAEREESEPEEASVVTRRNARKKAAEPAKEENHEKGKSEEQDKVNDEVKEVAPVTRRGARKKAAEPPKAEEHEKGKDEEQEEKNEDEEKEVAVVTRRGGRRKAAPEAALPPPPPRARPTRAAARRGREMDTGLDEGKSEMAGKVRGRVTRKASNAVLEDDDGGEHQEGTMAGTEEQIRNQPSAMAVMNGEEEKDKLEVVVGEVEQNAKASEAEDVPVARRGQARRAPKGKINAQSAASAQGGEEEDGGRGEEVGGKEEAGAGRSSLETMTLREWFERMEVYLPRMINEAAEEALSTLQERHRRIDEYISTLED